MGKIAIVKLIVRTGIWIDHNHIAVDGSDGGTFVDGKIDETVSFKIAGGADSCEQQGKIDGFPHSGSSGDGKNTANANAIVKLHLFKQSTEAGNTSCLETVFPLKLSDPRDGGYSRYFTWVDSGTIKTSDGTTMTFRQDQGKGNYLGKSDGTCQSYIQADPSNPSTGKLIIQADKGKPELLYTFWRGFPDLFNPDKDEVHTSGSCKSSDPLTIAIANPVGSDGKTPAGILAAGTGTVGDNTGTTGDDNQLECDGSSSALSWIICPVVDGLTKIIGAVDNMITDQMTIKTGPIFGDANGNCAKREHCDAYKTAWQSFRNIALGLMAIAGLIMVIAQALGMEILDAYTIRKTLPRILIAAIGITLSWTLMQFLVTLTNDLGIGIRHLIQAPFSDLKDEIHLGFGGDVPGFILGLGAIATGIFGLLTYAGMAALAVIIAIIVLILRQIAIILLILLAPVAIVAYILPNTQKIYKFWWGTFSKALLMFPLIAAFIASGQVFSAIAINNSTDPLNQLIGFGAYFAPYFLIPATFKFAGGALGQIGGFVNDRGRGGFDFLRKKRQENTGRRIQRARAGKLWNPEFGRIGKTSIGKIGNRAAMWGLDFNEMAPHRLGKWRVPGFKRYAAKAENEIDNATMDHSIKGYQEIESKGGMHYEGWRALSGSYRGYDQSTIHALTNAGFIDEQTGVSRGPSSLKDIDTLTKILSESGKEKEQLAAQGLRTARGTLATIGGSPEMYRADIQTMGAVGLAAAGRADLEDLAEIGNTVSARKGQDYAQRVVKKASDVGAQLRPETRFGQGIMIDTNGSKTGTQGKYYSVFDDPESNAAKSNAKSIKASGWAGAKAQAVKAARKTNMAIAREKDPSTGESTFEARAMQQLISNQSGPYGYNDTGAKAEWADMAAELRKAGVTMPNASQFDPSDPLRQQTPGPGPDGSDGPAPTVPPPLPKQ